MQLVRLLRKALQQLCLPCLLCGWHARACAAIVWRCSLLLLLLLLLLLVLVPLLLLLLLLQQHTL